LTAAGWGVVEGSRIRREYPITPGRIEGPGRRGKPLTADYVLEYRNRKLAVVEAKAWDEELTEGVAQGKNYAAKLAIRFAYASNGQGIYEIDLFPGQSGQRRHSGPPEREIAPFPAPDELWAMTFAADNAWRDRFAAVPFEDKGGSHPTRYCQDIAIERVMQAIEEDRKRILLTLATGHGSNGLLLPHPHDAESQNERDQRRWFRDGPDGVESEAEGRRGTIKGDEVNICKIDIGKQRERHFYKVGNIAQR